MKEIWKDVKGYEGLYQVSNLGRAKSLPRKIWSGKVFYTSKERILKGGKSVGYITISMHKRGVNQCTKMLHVLIAIAFLDHKPNGFKIVVDHKDNDKLNNHIDNLQLITNRENCSKDQHRRNISSKFVGVYWHKPNKKWRSIIKIDGKRKHLGIFKNEYDAHLAYQKALNNINLK